jgi:hypothetical protein
MVTEHASSEYCNVCTMLFSTYDLELLFYNQSILCKSEAFATLIDR